MGKNKGKHGRRTEFAKRRSILANLDNDLFKQKTEAIKQEKKKEKTKNENRVQSAD